MKYIKYFAILAAVALSAACTLKMEHAMLCPEEEYTAPVLSDVGNVISDANTAGVEAVVFNWTAADFGVSTQITYSLYAAIGDEAALIAQTQATSCSVAKGDLVGVLVNDLNADKNVKVGIRFYVTAAIAGQENSMAVKSNAVDSEVFTYLAPKRFMYLPGNYQGWSQFGTMFWETDGGSNIYKILVDVDGGKGEDPCYFKFVSGEGSWQGKNDGWKPTWEMPDEANKDGNFNVSLEEHIIRLTANTKTMTLDREVITFVGIVGDHTSWADNEAEFTYDPAENVWTVLADFEANKGFLIRLNQDWNMKFGDGIVASKEVEGGFELNESGSSANIPTPGAGTYKVILHANMTPWVITYEKQ